MNVNPEWKARDIVMVQAYTAALDMVTIQKLADHCERAYQDAERSDLHDEIVRTFKNAAIALNGILVFENETR